MGFRCALFDVALSSAFMDSCDTFFYIPQGSVMVVPVNLTVNGVA